MTANNANTARTELLAFTSAAIATLGACRTWDAALTRYMSAMTLCEADSRYGAYGRAEDAAAEVRAGIIQRFGDDYRNAPEAQPEWQAMFSQLDAATTAWSARFCAEQDAAALALAQTPAPTLAAATFKHMLIMREELQQSEAFPARCMDTLTNDFARLVHPANPSAWADAMEAMNAAKAEYDSNPSDTGLADYTARQADLITMPAPDRGALLWKLEYLLAASGDEIEPWDASFVAQTVADCRRLLSDPAAAPAQPWAAAYAAECAARQEAEQFHAANVTPVIKAHSESRASWDEAIAMEEAAAPFYKAHLDAVAAMIYTPAPSIAAVVHKIRVGTSIAFFDGADEAGTALDVIADDLERLTNQN